MSGSLTEDNKVALHLADMKITFTPEDAIVLGEALLCLGTKGKLAADEPGI